MLCCEVVDGLWAGNWNADNVVNDGAAVFNVAVDLSPYLALARVRDWEEYAHVGLIDGPGNTLATYCAAVLTLARLVNQYDQVFVCCHSGSRSLVVVTMYLTLAGGRRRPNVNTWSYWPEWAGKYGEVTKQCNMVQPSVVLPEIHQAHIDAHNKMPWGLLEVLL
jgi:hypothetical protein